MQSLLAVIDLNAIRNNAARIMRIAQRPLIAVVKDDAYGHGAAEVAHALSGMVCGFAVSSVEEGASLRTAGIEQNILVLTPPLSREEALRVKAYRLTASVGSLRTLRLLEKGTDAHIAVNSGMNRYGIAPDRAGVLADAAKREGIPVTGVYSHFYAPADENARGDQLRRFLAATLKVRERFPAAVRHIAATGGILSGVALDAVRAGIALYGYCPDGYSLTGLRPAMKIYAAVADAHRPVGRGAGYNVNPERGTGLYTLRLGYGDGFFRSFGPCIGTLGMDACVAKGTARPGTRKLVLSDAAAYADEHGTTAYEVLVNVSKKAEKVYRNP